MNKRSEDEDGKPVSEHDIKKAATDAARALAMRSVAARKKKWGEKGFKNRMREWGKLGGRPRKKPNSKKGRETS